MIRSLLARWSHLHYIRTKKFNALEGCFGSIVALMKNVERRRRNSYLNWIINDEIQKWEVGLPLLPALCLYGRDLKRRSLQFAEEAVLLHCCTKNTDVLSCILLNTKGVVIRSWIWVWRLWAKGVPRYGATCSPCLPPVTSFEQRAELQKPIGS